MKGLDFLIESDGTVASGHQFSFFSFTVRTSNYLVTGLWYAH